MKRKTSRYGLKILLLVMSWQSLSWAAPGDPDTSFNGTGGVATTMGVSSSFGLAVAAQADKKIVVGGYANNGANLDFAVARFQPDGSLDTSFGGTGKILTHFGSGNDVAYAVAVQPDQKIVLAGYSFNGFDDVIGLARYLPDGTPDTSFGGTGRVSWPILGTGTRIRSVEVLRDGRLVVAGKTIQSGVEKFVLAGFEPNGSLNAIFGGAGVVIYGVGGTEDQAAALAVQPDGKFLVAGYSKVGGVKRFAVARHDQSGFLDTTFNGTGYVTTVVGVGDAEARSVAVQPDGKIVVGGKANSAASTDFALVRYNADGTLDTSFGTAGIVFTDFAGNEDEINGLLVQGDGKIIACGYAVMPPSDAAMARYLPNGSLDPSFGTGGKVLFDLSGANNDLLSSLAVLPDGRFAGGGYAFIGGIWRFAAMRFQGDSTVSVARSGSLAPELPAAAKWRITDTPILSSNGLTAFSATVAGVTSADSAALGQGRRGIWAEDFAVKRRLVALIGEDAPGLPGSKFTSLSSPVINNRSDVLFYGRAGSTPGLWARRNGVLGLVAKMGDAAPGGGSFKDFPAFALPDDGGAVFLAKLNGAGGGRRGIYAVDSSNIVQMVVREGTPHPANGKLVRTVSILGSAPRVMGQTRHVFGDRLMYSVRYVDGSWEIFQAGAP